MLSSPLLLAPTSGICSLPPCDWLRVEYPAAPGGVSSGSPPTAARNTETRQRDRGKQHLIDTIASDAYSCITVRA
eukprot:9006080-Pyramimonas_sp.AAC.1